MMGGVFSCLSPFSKLSTMEDEVDLQRRGGERDLIALGIIPKVNWYQYLYTILVRAVLYGG